MLPQVLNIMLSVLKKILQNVGKIIKSRVLTKRNRMLSFKLCHAVISTLWGCSWNVWSPQICRLNRRETFASKCSLQYKNAFWFLSLRFRGQLLAFLQRSLPLSLTPFHRWLRLEVNPPGSLNVPFFGISKCSQRDLSARGWSQLNLKGILFL